MIIWRKCLLTVRLIGRKHNVIDRTFYTSCVTPTLHLQNVDVHFHRGVKTTTSASSKSKKEQRPPRHQYSRRADLNFDTVGSWNNRLELQLDVEQSIKAGKIIPEIGLQNVGIASLVGRRKVNEDRHRVANLTPSIMMVSIFDGHGGRAAADFVSYHMELHIKQWLERGEKDLGEVLRKSFIEVNNAYARHCHYSDDETAFNSGTTATVALLRNSRELVLAHVGDSKALMCRTGKVVRLTQDHKPDDPREFDRIKAAGGIITRTSIGNSRVNGKLDMTRSIGDLELKAVGVTAEPDIRSIEVNHMRDSFLVLTTDGVSHIIADQEVISITNACKVPKEAAQRITDQALHFGSEDNVTALVLAFGAWGRFVSSAQSVQFSFGRNIIGSRYN